MDGALVIARLCIQCLSEFLRSDTGWERDIMSGYTFMGLVVSSNSDPADMTIQVTLESLMCRTGSDSRH